MTTELGIGMFFYGIICTFIGAMITYYFLNRQSREEKENEEYLKELERKL